MMGWSIRRSISRHISKFNWYEWPSLHQWLGGLFYREIKQNSNLMVSDRSMIMHLGNVHVILAWRNLLRQ